MYLQYYVSTEASCELLIIVYTGRSTIVILSTSFEGTYVHRRRGGML